MLAFAIINLLPVSTRKHTPFVPDMPLLVLATLVLSPAQVAVARLAGALDPLELQGRITPTRAIFNRSQVAFNAFLGSLVVHRIEATPGHTPYVVGLALLALLVNMAANTALVATAVSVDRGLPVSGVIQKMFVGEPRDYVITLCMAAIFGAALAAIYELNPVLALAAALAVSLLSRQTLARSQMLVDTRRAYRSREQALQQLSVQIAQERTDERRLIAAELHDEILQPLFKVTLMAQVLKNDLAGGRLLDLDEDLPELLTATDLASTTLRELIGDLRRSALGRGGLAPALVRFLETARDKTQCEIHSEVQDVQVSPDVELVVYQIAKEATSNALTHSKAKNVAISLNQQDGTLHLLIADDGIGFDPATIPDGHYGVQIMQERALAIGAKLWVDTSVGHGTRIHLSLPVSDQGERT